MSVFATEFRDSLKRRSHENEGFASSTLNLEARKSRLSCPSLGEQEQLRSPQRALRS